MGFEFYSDTPVNDGVWHHIVVSREPDGTGRIYIDGDLSASGFEPPVTLVTRRIGIGSTFRKVIPQPISSGFLEGSIDELAFFDRALTVNEVAAMFQAGGAGVCRSDVVFTDWIEINSVLTGPNQAVGRLGDIDVSFAGGELLQGHTERDYEGFNNLFFNPPIPASDAVIFRGGLAASNYIYRIGFSERVVDPIIYLSSLASTLTFFTGGSSALSRRSGEDGFVVASNTVSGLADVDDSLGAVQLHGVFRSITFGADYPIPAGEAVRMQVGARLPISGRIEPPVAGGDDRFGWAIAMDGDTLVIGAPTADRSGNNTGTAYVYRRTSTGWKLQQELAPNSIVSNGLFGHSVALSDDTLVVGARGGSGSAHVFRRTDSFWRFMRTLAPPDAGPDDQFGQAVDVDGTNIVIGSLKHNQFRGAAYVYSRDMGGSDQWGLVAKLAPLDLKIEDNFGISVAISGDTIAIGAHDDNPFDTCYSYGAVYVFDRNLGGADRWGQVKKLYASDRTCDAHFGRSVALDGRLLVVGAYSTDDRGIDSGSAYVFCRDEGGIRQWGQIDKLVPADGMAYANFGTSVGVSGSRITVGTPGTGQTTSHYGAAYGFDQTQGSGGKWGLVTSWVSTDPALADEFGWGVAVSGQTVAIGAPWDDLSGVINAGSVQLQTLPPLQNSVIECGVSRELWVSAQTGKAIGRFDADTGRFLGIAAQLSLSSNPKNARKGPDGYLYVATQFGDSVAKYHPVTGEYLGDVVPKGTSGVSYIEGITFSPDGVLYVGSWGYKRVLRFDLRGQYVGDAVPQQGPGSLSEGPVDLEFGPDGNLYVSTVTATIKRYTADGRFLGDYATSPDPNIWLWGFDFDADGNLFAAAFFNGTVYKFEAGTGRRILSFEVPAPYAVECGAGDELYIADGSGIQRYSSKGDHLGQLVPAGSGGLGNFSWCTEVRR